MQIKPQSFKEFEKKAPKGLKNRAVYEIDYDAKGILDDIISILDTFIMRKHQKSIGIMLINQSDEIKWIPQIQHTGTVHLVKGQKKKKHRRSFNDQVQLKRPLQHQEKQKLSPETKRKLDEVINEYSDIFSKDQYNIGQSTHPL